MFRGRLIASGKALEELDKQIYRSGRVLPRGRGVTRVLFPQELGTFESNSRVPVLPQEFVHIRCILAIAITIVAELSL